ncbi:MAG: thioredoxin-disulfide reductase [Spirochaetes bacterium]|jgi:thioredoxin reductase (NADPH)|nr:thioredoxin-disulfide reductase [Spirochaetota bacterium]
MQASHDLIVIGGGAAGLAAAQYGARANLRTLVVEQMANGGQCLLIEGLENYPGFPDPIDGDEFTERFERQAKQFGAQFQIATVEGIEKEGDVFRLSTSEGELTAFSVVLATGAKHRTLDVPGEAELQGRGVSYCATCDGPFFKNQRILVVGGGDAACDEATFLSKLTDKLIMVHRRDRFRAQKSLAQRVLNNENIDVRFNTVVKEIHGKPGMMGMQKVGSVTFQDTVTGEEYTEEMDAVFVFIGSIPQTGLAPFAEMDEAGYIKTDEHMETSAPGFYAVGDVRTTPFRQLVVAAGDGAIAAHSASQHIDALMDQQYEPAMMA